VSKALLEKDELDAAREYSRKAFEEVRTKNSKIIGWDGANPAWTDLCTRQLEINVKHSWDNLKGGKATTPWAEPKLRRALALLIDRKQLAAGTYDGLARPSVTMFPAYEAMSKFVAAATSAAAGFEISDNAKPVEAEQLFTASGYAKDAKTGFYTKGPDTLTEAFAFITTIPIRTDMWKGRA
jgi:ABC-type oligopeptide transport system substrate-binding subunit